MKPLKVLDTIVGATMKLTWVNSGITPSGIQCNLYDKTETLVGSVAGVSSGNGFYYAPLLIPNSAGVFVNKWFSVINGNTYVTPQYIRATRYEAD
jgi:hypothetical protein